MQRGSAHRCAALVLAFGLGAACRPDGSSKVKCDMFEYVNPAFETTAKIGKFGAELASQAERLRQVDGRVKQSLAHWNTICREFNAGTRGHTELRNGTQAMRRLNSWFWPLAHATDSAAYQAAFQALYAAEVPPAGTVPTPE